MKPLKSIAKFALVLCLLLGLPMCGPPTYVDPVTHEEIACSELPAVTLETTIAELAQVYSTKGLPGVYTYALGKGVAYGGCALAYFLNDLLTVTPGEQPLSDAEAVAARKTLEDARAEFLRLEQDKALKATQSPPRRIIWIDAEGHAL